MKEQHEWSEGGKALLNTFHREISLMGGCTSAAARIMAENRLIFEGKQDECLRVLYYRHDMRTLAGVFSIPLRQVYRWAEVLGLKRNQSIRRLVRRRSHITIECLDLETGVFYDSLRDAAAAISVKTNSIYNNVGFSARIFRIEEDVA